MLRYPHSLRIVILVSLFNLYALTSWAVSPDKADRIFNKAEVVFPEVFVNPDNSVATQQIPGWLYRFYPATNTYLGIDSQDDVYTLSDANLAHHGSVTEINQRLGIQDCVTLGKPPANFVIPYSSRFPAFEPQTSTARVNISYIRLDETGKHTRHESIDPITNQTINILTLTQNHQLQDGFIVINSSTRSSESFNNDGSSNSSTTTSTHSPPSLSMPYSTLCFEQSWQVPTYTQISQATSSTGPTRNFSREIAGYPVLVKSIDEILETPIGNITTAHIIYNFESLNTIIVRREIWYSIDYGIPVKTMEFDGSNNVHILQEIDL